MQNYAKNCKLPICSEYNSRCAAARRIPTRCVDGMGAAFQALSPRRARGGGKRAEAAQSVWCKECGVTRAAGINGLAPQQGAARNESVSGQSWALRMGNGTPCVTPNCTAVKKGRGGGIGWWRKRESVHGTKGMCAAVFVSRGVCAGRQCALWGNFLRCAVYKPAQCGSDDCAHCGRSKADPCVG